MSEYKRLTDKKVKGTTERYIRVDKNYILSTYDIITEEKYEMVDMLLNRLAELEDKIENGTLMELPCKVGDKAWYLVTQPTLYLSRNTIYSGVITRIYITKKDLHCAIQIRNDKGVTEIPIIINTKENLFFTKAEAEARLKELKGEV